MGCGRRVASEKCSWNQGLPAFPATFGPDNPLKPPRADSLTQGELAPGQGEILTAARLATFRRGGQAFEGPVEPVPPRRMIAATQGLHHTAHQPATGVQRQPVQDRPVECKTSVLPRLDERDPGPGGLDLPAGPHPVSIRLPGLDHPC